jgi:hypothetical protein
MAVAPAAVDKLQRIQSDTGWLRRTSTATFALVIAIDECAGMRVEVVS